MTCPNPARRAVVPPMSPADVAGTESVVVPLSVKLVLSMLVNIGTDTCASLMAIQLWLAFSNTGRLRGAEVNDRVLLTADFNLERSIIPVASSWILVVLTDSNRGVMISPLLRALNAEDPLSSYRVVPGDVSKRFTKDDKSIRLLFPLASIPVDVNRIA